MAYRLPKRGENPERETSFGGGARLPTGVQVAEMTPEKLQKTHDYLDMKLGDLAKMGGRSAPPLVANWTLREATQNRLMSGSVMEAIGPYLKEQNITPNEFLKAAAEPRPAAPKPAQAPAKPAEAPKPPGVPLPPSPSKPAPAPAAAPPAPARAPASAPAAVGTPTKGDPRGMADYIRATAQKYGINPDTALAVARSEGLGTFQSSVPKTGKGGFNGREDSWGAFQLYMGGGLGNQFQKETGLDPRDPKNERATIDYALRHAAKNGWGAFHGAANTGIGNWAGIGKDAANEVKLAGPYTPSAPEPKSKNFVGVPSDAGITSEGQQTAEVRPGIVKPEGGVISDAGITSEGAPTSEPPPMPDMGGGGGLGGGAFDAGKDLAAGGGADAKGFDYGKALGGFGDELGKLGEGFGKMAGGAGSGSRSNNPYIVPMQMTQPGGPVPIIDPKTQDMQRQQLAMAMQRLNAGKLF